MDEHTKDRFSLDFGTPMEVRLLTPTPKTCAVYYAGYKEPKGNPARGVLCFAQTQESLDEGRYEEVPYGGVEILAQLERRRPERRYAP